MKGVYMIRLVLKDRKGTALSINDYLMRGEGTADFMALEDIPLAKVKATVLRPSADGRRRIEIRNTGSSVALNIKLNVRDRKSGEIMLPAYFSDGYFHLMPGERRVLEYDSPHEGAISAEGYNLSNQIIVK